MWRHGTQQSVVARGDDQAAAHDHYTNVVLGTYEDNGSDEFMVVVRTQ